MARGKLKALFNRRFALFLPFGSAYYIVTILIRMDWQKKIENWYGLPRGYWDQPAEMQLLERFITWSPLLVLALLALLDYRRRNFSRAAGFAAGLALIWTVALFYLLSL